MPDSKLNDKRSSPRIPIQEKIIAKVEIILPYPKGYKIKKDLLDLGETGFSFIIPSEEGYLAKGTPLKEIKLTYDDKVFPLSGEVAYVARIPRGDGLDFKIGIQVSKNIKLTSNGDRPDRYRVRPKRYNFEFLSNLGGVFSCSDKNFELTGEIINISKFGAAFKTKNEIILKPSQTLDHVKIIFHDEIIFSGNITVINVRESTNDMIVGISFQNSFADIDYLSHLRERADTKGDIENFVQSLRIIDKVDEKFKSEVMAMRFYLEQIEEKLIREEERIKNLDLEKQKLVEQDILITLRDELKDSLDKFCIKIDEIVKGHSPDQHSLNKDFFQKNLHPFILQSNYAQRVYKKPLGYGGDYEMINMIVRNDYEGQRFFSKLIHYYTVSTPPAVAVRNRVKYLMDAILQEGEKSPNECVTITSIGCGPAIEIQQLIQNGKLSEQFEFNLIDFDEVALNYVEEILCDSQKRFKSDVRINYFNLSIREILKRKELIPNLTSQNLIYSTGLFDYLSESICKKMIEISLKQLSENGRLIIGNFSLQNKFKHFMEYAGEWYLYHRSEPDLIKIIPETNQRYKVQIERENTGIQIFLNVLNRTKKSKI